MALQANYLEVELDVAPDGCPGRLLCTRRTRLSHRGEAVYVGDRVRVEAIDPGQGRAVVAEVEPRHSFLTPTGGQRLLGGCGVGSGTAQF